ncbi:MAG: alpha/beta hydrolase [Alloalcanivorax xenomutans]
MTDTDNTGDAGRETTLAFAHANGVPGHSYDTFLAPLAEHYDVRIMECLAHDARFPVDADWKSLSLELEEWMRELPKPLIGLGHSMGSVLMFHVAQRHPDWFKALIMLDPPMANGFRGVVMRGIKALGLQDRFTPAGLSKTRLDHWDSWDDVESYFGSRGFFKAFDPRCLRDYLRAGLERHGDGWRLRFRPAIEVAIFREVPTGLTRMPRLKVPGALVTGQDSPAPFHHSGARHARRHRLRRLFSPGGHMYPLQYPERTAEMVRELIVELTGAEHVLPADQKSA